MFLSELDTSLQILISQRGVKHWAKNYFLQGGMLKFTYKGHSLTIKCTYKKLFFWKSKQWAHVLMTSLVGVRFCRHAPNSNRNKIVNSSNLYQFQKMVFWDSKTLLSPFGIEEKNFFFNFECYEFANDKEWECKVWWACRNRS